MVRNLMNNLPDIIVFATCLDIIVNRFFEICNNF